MVSGVTGYFLLGNPVVTFTLFVIRHKMPYFPCTSTSTLHIRRSGLRRTEIAEVCLAGDRPSDHLPWLGGVSGWDTDRL